MSGETERAEFLELISGTEIEDLRKAGENGIRHPVAALALAAGPNQVKTNTERAARQVILANKPWLSGIKHRLVDTSDFTNASSALGEIRAYGSLLETGMAVTPGPPVGGKSVKPEFEVDTGDSRIIVEVHSRQLDKAQLHSIAEHHRKLREQVKKVRAANPGKAAVVSSALSVAPMGAPDPLKPGDSVLTNCISRICGIKASEKQSDPKKPFVLWLDLQDPLVWGTPIAEEQVAPLYTSPSGAVDAGALWFALYGKKDDPMIEMRSCDFREIKMLHDGRFARTKQLAAVVYSMPRLTVLMENPSPALEVGLGFRSSLLKAPFFAIDRSVIEWRPGLVASYLDLQNLTIAAAIKALVASNPE